MKFAKFCCWIFLGLLLAASGVHAQETANNDADSKAKASVKKSQIKKSKIRVAAKKSAKPSARAIRAQREAEARAKAEQGARQRAEVEAKAKRQAEDMMRAKAEQEAFRRAESRKQAEMMEAREKPLRDADALIKNGKPSDAYALLEPLEFERSGEVRFDYLLGIAALDSGKPDKATLIFERVLAVSPNFAGARLDMARAYYQLGDLPRAKTEFEEVMKQNPPEAARATIQKYLVVIAAHAETKKTRITGYVEGVAGHDSNIANSSTQTFTFAPGSPWNGLFPGNQLPPAAKLAGAYEGMNAGVEINHSMSANWSVFAAVDLHQHGNTTQKLYDSTSTDGRVGVMYANEKNAYRLTLTNGEVYSASTMRRDSVGVNAELQHTFSPSNQMSAFVQFGKNRAFGFPPTSPSTDARIEGNTDQVVAGAGWVHITADGKKALFGSIYGGKELDVAPVVSVGLPNGGRADGKKRFGGLRIGGQAAITEQMEAIASFGWQSAIYGNINNLIMARREENLYDLSIGANWHFGKLWTLKPQIALSKKNSNVAIYSFDRTDISLAVRREFK